MPPPLRYGPEIGRNSTNKEETTYVHSGTPANINMNQLTQLIATPQNVTWHQCNPCIPCRHSPFPIAGRIAGLQPRILQCNYNTVGFFLVAQTSIESWSRLLIPSYFFFSRSCFHFPFPTFAQPPNLSPLRAYQLSTLCSPWILASHWPS